METESYVEAQLSKFLQSNLPDASKSAIDEIVLSYVVSILEELGSEAAAEDAFDIEQFTEMMDAYIPGFAEMDSVAITEWMFGLSSELERKKHEPPTSDPCMINGDEEKCAEARKPDGGQKRTHSTSEREDLACAASGGSDSETASSTPTEPDHAESADPEVELLMEMFPNACHSEIAHCLGVSKGHVEQAAQLMLHRQDAGESIISTHKTSQTGLMRKPGPKDDKKLKQSILNKYSFIDTHEDKVDHRPVMPKTEPKKLIRYLDNKIVTTKGERFVEIKKDDEAEVVKKTSVHLKPARQYRFH